MFQRVFCFADNNALRNRAVSIGDVIWPVLALLTLGQLVAVHVAVLTGLKYVAVSVFVVMGVGLNMARLDKL